MQPDFERSAAALTGFTQKAIAAAVAPLLEQNQLLVRRIEHLEARPEAASEVVILRLVQDEVAKIPVPQDGKDADPEVTERLIGQKVAEAVAVLPKPEDGKSVTAEEITPLLADMVQKAVAAVPMPRSVVGVVVNRDGDGVYTYNDGSTENIGRVVGIDGKDADMVALEKRIDDHIASIPKPKDGRDGFELDDYDEWLEDDGRTLVRRYTRGDDFKEFRHQTAMPIYRGVFKDGTVYMKGDTVTWGGCMWHCNDATTAKPDAGPWTLATRKGRDGKDAK